MGVPCLGGAGTADSQYIRTRARFALADPSSEQDDTTGVVHALLYMLHVSVLTCIPDHVQACCACTETHVQPLPSRAAGFAAPTVRNRAPLSSRSI